MLCERQPKADSTLRSSRAVPHPSTNRALRRFTSEVGRDPVCSTRYGRQRYMSEDQACPILPQQNMKKQTTSPEIHWHRLGYLLCRSRKNPHGQNTTPSSCAALCQNTTHARHRCDCNLLVAVPQSQENHEDLKGPRPCTCACTQMLLSPLPCVCNQPPNRRHTQMWKRLG